MRLTDLNMSGKRAFKGFSNLKSAFWLKGLTALIMLCGTSGMIQAAEAPATGSLVIENAEAPATGSLVIENESYSYTTGFSVDEDSVRADGSKEVIGYFAEHPVYKSAAPGYSLRPVLAYVQNRESLDASEPGALLTTTFVLRCADMNRECVRDELKTFARMNNVNEVYKLRTLEVADLENWQKVYDYYRGHQNEFARFYPVLDKGKALRNKDSGLFGGKDSGRLFKQSTD